MVNGKLQYGENSEDILLKIGIDNVFNKANGKGLDNILLEFAFKFMTMINGFKNFQMVTELADINIKTDTFTFQDVVNNVPEQSICWFRIPSTATIVSDGQAGNLLMFTAPWWDKNTGDKPIPMISFFMNPVTNITWFRYYDGVGGDTNWYPLYRYKVETALNENFTGRFDLWQYGNVIWLNGSVTNVAEISTEVEVGTIPSIYAPDFSLSNVVEIPTGFGVVIVNGTHVYIRKAATMTENIPAGTTFYLNTSWMAKCDWS